MKTVLAIFSLIGLASCATPSSVQIEPDYEICRLSLLRPPLQSRSAILEADRQILIRGINCSSYAGVIFQQQNEGLNQLQRSLEMIERQNGSGKVTSTQGWQPTTCYKTREWTSGRLRNCGYNCLGSEAISSISIAEACPISIKN